MRQIAAAVVAGCLIVGAGGAARAAAPSFNFTSYTAAASTFPGGINSLGQIAGYDGLASSAAGFVRSPGGTLSGFSISGAKAGTKATGINDAGTVVGTYSTSSSYQYGFTRSATGVVTTITDPNTQNPYSTYANGIDNAGDVVGYYYLYTPGTIGDFGFLESAAGTFVDIIVPSAIGTFATGINNLGEVVGYYEDDQYDTIGFLRDALGNYTAIADPNAPDATYAEGINDAGDVVGYYVNGSGRDVGFEETPDGSFVDIIDPSATKTQGTMATGINDAGVVVGSYGAVTASHGFLAVPVAVPEPGSFGLLGGALAWLAVLRRRRR